MLKNGGTVEPPEDKFISPLGVAAANGNLPLVTLLVDHGADPNWRGPASPSLFAPLQRAVSTRRPEIVAFLLAHGARPDPPMVYGTLIDSDKTFPAEWRQKSIQIMELLVRDGALKKTPELMKGIFLEAASLKAESPSELLTLTNAGFNPKSISPGKNRPVLDLVQEEYAKRKTEPDGQNLLVLLNILQAATKGSVSSQPTVIVTGQVGFGPNDQIDWTKTTGSLKSGYGTQLDFSFQPDGTFTIPHVWPGLFYPSIFFVRKTQAGTPPEVAQKSYDPVTLNATSAKTPLLLSANGPFNPSPPVRLKSAFSSSKYASPFIKRIATRLMRLWRKTISRSFKTWSARVCARCRSPA